MGEAINLVENFRVEKVIFNCGEFNKLEKDFHNNTLIELLKTISVDNLKYFESLILYDDLIEIRLKIHNLVLEKLKDRDIIIISRVKEDILRKM